MSHVLRKSLVMLAAACLLSGAPVGAQSLTDQLVIPDSDVLQRLTLDDGSTLIGSITEVGDTNVKFKTDMGELSVEIARIRDIELIDASAMQDGEYWFPNPNTTRLMMGPTARTLKEGTGYFSDLWIFFPGLAYGITDNIMISGAASIFPGAGDQLFYFAPKVGFPATEKLDLAASLMIFRLWNETVYFGVANVTYGTGDASVTGGLGLAWNDGEMADDPVGTLGGEYRMSRRTALVAESWFIPGSVESGALLMGGVRLFGEQMAVDIGFAYSAETDNRTDEEVYYDENDPHFEDDDDTDWIPYIDFVYNF